MSSRKVPAELCGLGVAVTRPAHQAEHLVRLIESEGGHAVTFPVLEIAEIEDPGPVLATIRQLDSFQLAIFISINAVEQGMRLVLSVRGWPPRLSVAAVGRGTADALAGFGFRRVICPSSRFHSEGLLAMPALQAGNVAGQRIVIFRGEGGRELLAHELTERGARVTYAEVYRRGMPQVDSARVEALMEDRAVDAVVVTSAEGLRNLRQMLGRAGDRWLGRKTLVVASHRMAEVAGELGIRSPVVVAKGAGDDALLEALKHWRNTR